MILPGLVATEAAAPAPAPAPAIESESVSEAGGPIALPEPQPTADAPLPLQPSPVEPDAVTAPEAPAPAPAPTPAPVPTPAQVPEPEPTPPPRPPVQPSDTVALPPSVSSIDTAGGIVQPIVSGTAEPGAAVTISAGAGGSWTTAAASSGAFTIELAGLQAGRTDLAVTQVDVAGNASAPAVVGVDLVAPTLVIDSTDTRRPIITLSGVSGTTVEIVFAGTVTEIVTLDGGSVELRGNVLANIITMSNPEVSMRYLGGGRAGSWAPATYVG